MGTRLQSLLLGPCHGLGSEKPGEEEGGVHHLSLSLGHLWQRALTRGFGPCGAACVLLLFGGKRRKNKNKPPSQNICAHKGRVGSLYVHPGSGEPRGWRLPQWSSHLIPTCPQ